MNNYGDAYQGYHGHGEITELSKKVEELSEAVAMLSSLVEALCDQPGVDKHKVVGLAAEIHLKNKGVIYGKEGSGGVEK